MKRGRRRRKERQATPQQQPEVTEEFITNETSPLKVAIDLNGWVNRQLIAGEKKLHGP